jgi:hypothetical protein
VRNRARGRLRVSVHWSSGGGPVAVGRGLHPTFTPRGGHRGPWQRFGRGLEGAPDVCFAYVS